MHIVLYKSNTVYISVRGETSAFVQKWASMRENLSLGLVNKNGKDCAD